MAWKTQRYNALSMRPESLDAEDLLQLALVLTEDSNIQQAGMLTEEDNYYFTLHNEVTLPVYKIVADDAEQTIYYLDPKNGSLLAKYDSANKGFRWFHLGLHRLDFTGFLRTGLFRDFFMWFFLSGVTLGISTGLVTGFKRVLRSF